MATITSPANLAVDNYGYGVDARYDSWAILAGGTTREYEA
jgi:hypothetical protein